jgi:hypothetical protein
MEKAQTSVVLGNWISTSRRIKLDTHLIQHTKVNSKCVKGLNVRPEIIKVPKKTKGNAKQHYV